MNQIEYLCSTHTIMTNIRNGDKAVIVIVFVFLVGMLPVLRTLWFVDLFILNLLHPIDVFFIVKDWKKCSKDLFFGLMYSLATRCENIGLTFFWGAAVVTVWIAIHPTDGHPCFRWIFFPCSLIHLLSFYIKWAPEAVVCVFVFKTAWTFIFQYPNKTLEDSLLVFTFMFLHLVFAQEDYNIHYLALSYAFSFAWMHLKHST